VGMMNRVVMMIMVATVTAAPALAADEAAQGDKLVELGPRSPLEWGLCGRQYRLWLERL
jgi:hypothetical protein